MTKFRRHLTAALRQFRLAPGFTLAIVTTLGLAIGANTAIYSFVNALLLRPYPFRDAEQLAEIDGVRGGQPGKLSMREILDIRDNIESVEAIAAHTGGAGGYNYSGTGTGRPEEWRAILTTGNLFDVLGVSLAAGSKWPAEPADRQRDFRVILTHGVWQRSFGASPDVLDKSISLDHAPGYRIHGVAPKGFDYPRGIDVYRSIGGFTDYERRENRNVIGIVRIRRPTTLDQFQSQLDVLSRRLQQQYPTSNAGLSFRAEGMRERYSGTVRPYLLLLLGAVGFVLLIACANVVNLLLSRAISREREMGVRVALGAGPGDLLGQMLTESVVLAAVSGTVGVALAFWWMRLLKAMIGAQLPAWMTVELDTSVLLFASAISLGAGLLAGLAPALHILRPGIAGLLREGGRGGTAGVSGRRLRDAMIVAEVAVAVVLLAGAGLLIRSFMHLQETAKGFDSSEIATFRVALGWRRYGGERITQYYERALDAVRAIPGVRAAEIVPHPPLGRQEESEPTLVAAEGQSYDESLRNPYIVPQAISEGYFAMMRIPLLSGRAFTQHDGATGEPVAIVSRRLAERLWPGQDPIGKRLQRGYGSSRPDVFRRVIGVAADVQHEDLGGESGFFLYYHYRQRPESNQYVLAKTSLPLMQFQRQAEQALWAIDAEQSLFDFESYDERILKGIWQLRLSRLLLVLFSLVALVLAAVGVYGVMAYLVGQRQREMGIRIALGASPAQVQALVVGRAMRLGGAGLLLGTCIAAALGVVARGAVQDLRFAEPGAYATAILLLAVVVSLAAWLPARRASAVDPATTLRSE